MKKPNAKPTVFDRVQTILESAQIHAARTVNTTQVVANWLIGQEIVEEQQQGAKRAGYGEDIIAKLAADLKGNGVVGYGELTLKLCRQFFLSYPNLAGSPIVYAVRKQFADNEAGRPIRYALRNKSESDEGKDEKVYAARKQSRQKDDPEIGYALRSQSPEALILVPQIIEAARAVEWQPGMLHPGLSWTHYRTLMRVSNLQARSFHEIGSHSAALDGTRVGAADQQPAL